MHKLAQKKLMSDKNKKNNIKDLQIFQLEVYELTSKACFYDLCYRKIPTKFRIISLIPRNLISALS